MLKISRELNSCEANISKALSENLNERDYYLVFLVSLKCHSTELITIEMLETLFWV